MSVENPDFNADQEQVELENMLRYFTGGYTYQEVKAAAEHGEAWAMEALDAAEASSDSSQT